MNTQDELFRQVQAELAQNSRMEPRPIVAASLLRTWMKSTSLDVQGLVFDFIMNSGHQRISPALTFDDYKLFVPHYLVTCILQDPRSEWAANRSRAAYEFLRWFGILWDDSTIQISAISELKKLLRSLSLNYGAEIRDTVTHEILEHLFENSSVSEFFSEWRTYPELHAIYEDALEWKKGGGSSPLAPKAIREYKC